MDIMDKVTYFSVSWRFTFMVISIIGSSVLLLLLLSSIQSIHLTNNIQYDNCQLSRVSRVSALICYSSSDTATRQLCDTGRYIHRYANCCWQITKKSSTCSTSQPNYSTHFSHHLPPIYLSCGVSIAVYVLQYPTSTDEWMNKQQIQLVSVKKAEPTTDQIAGTIKKTCPANIGIVAGMI